MGRAAYWTVAICVMAAIAIITLDHLLFRKTLSLPPIAAGEIYAGRDSAPRRLAPAELATISNWLRSHRSKWSPVFATAAVSNSIIRLKSNRHGDTFDLVLFPDIEHATGTRSIFVYTARGIWGYHEFSDEELSPLIEIFQG